MVEREKLNRARSFGIARHRKVLYSIVATVLGLAIVELVCRLAVATAPNDRWGHHAKLVDTIGFASLNEILEPDPELFWSLRRDLISRTLRGRIGDSESISFTVSTDKHGRRRLPENSGARHIVLFLGDSCTFGVGVDDNHTFAALLQQRLIDVQCINAGVPGYTSYQGYGVLQDIRLSRVPDVVIIAFLFNDDSSWDGLSDLQHARLQGGLTARLISYSRFASLLHRLRPIERQPSRSPLKRPRLSDDEYYEQVKQIIELCRQRGGKPILVVWPLRSQMSDLTPRAKQGAVRHLGKELNVPVVDLVAAFRESGGSELFVDVVHANQRGHALVADQLEGIIRRELQERRANTAR